jgi:putative oxidoreductase
MKRQTVIEIFVAALFLLFLFAAILKGATFQQYIYDMRTQPLPNWMIWLATYGLPPFHLALAVLLIPAKTRLSALYASTALMLVYTLYISGMYFEWIDDRPCSCTGITRNMSWGQHFWFNVGFLTVSALALILTLLPKKSGSAPDGKGYRYPLAQLPS